MYSKEIQKEIEELKAHVKIRSQMGGNLYYNILNDECCQKAQSLADKGVNKDELSEILGPGTHTRN